MRILRDKNEQKWSSRFGETYIVLILRSDRYSVGPVLFVQATIFFMIQQL